MAKLIELTGDDKRFWVNTDLILSIMEDTFNTETKLLMSNGVIFSVKESAVEIVSRANPH